MNALLILGAGGHGKVVADTALEMCKWNEVIFLDDAWPEKQKIGHWDICEKISNLAKLKPRCKEAVVAIGNNHLRMELQNRLVEVGFDIANIIHPSAKVSRFAYIGSGSVVFANAVVNVDAVIAEGAIINTAATIDHDCQLGMGVHISPGANLGGGVKVGDFSWVGIGASVRHLVSVGANVTIGAGAVVVSDIHDGVTAVGLPARPINKITGD